MFQFNMTDIAQLLGRENVQPAMTDEQFIVTEIARFHRSKRFTDMKNGVRYYEGNHDILHKQRTAIGEKGELVVIENLPNNKIVDNQYKKMTKQKVNYLVGQPFVIRSPNKAFLKAIEPYIMTKKFMKLLTNVSYDALNCGIGWMLPYYDERGEFGFKRMDPREIIPEWKDAEHTVLDAAIRHYEVVEYIGTTEKIVQKVEVYDENGISYFELNNGNLIPEAPSICPISP